MKKRNICLIIILFLLPAFVVVAGEGWTEKKPMPTPRTGICAAFLNGKIYVIGGQTSNGQIVDIVERYDPLTDSWETGLPRLENERVNAAAVVFEGKIFVMGGKNGDGEVLNKVEIFDPAKNQWKSASELEEKRQGLAAVVLKDVIYVLGGSDEEDILLKDVEFYNKNEEEWHKVEGWELEQPRASFASVALKDSVFSIGGFTSFGPIGNVQRYHPTVGMAQRRSVLIPRGGFAATAIGDTIYALGGRSRSSKVLSSVVVYAPRLNRWQHSASLNIARENFAVVAVNNRIFAIGGKDAVGNVLASVEGFDIITSIKKKQESIPEDFTLEQNYPNPFNAGTKIKFRVSSGTISEPVRLHIYNVKGQLIATLVEEKLNPGEYEILWNGTDQRGFPVASGIYIYTVTQGQIKLSKKMTLMR